MASPHEKALGKMANPGTALGALQRSTAKHKGKELRKSIEKHYAEGRTSLDYHQSRSLMRHVNKPN